MILLRIINSINILEMQIHNGLLCSSQGKRIIITPGDLCKLYLCNEKKFKDCHITRDNTCSPNVGHFNNSTFSYGHR